MRCHDHAKKGSKHCGWKGPKKACVECGFNVIREYKIKTKYVGALLLMGVTLLGILSDDFDSRARMKD